MKFSQKTIGRVSYWVLVAFISMFAVPFAVRAYSSGTDWDAIFSWKFVLLFIVIYFLVGLAEWWIWRTLDRMQGNGGASPSAYELREFEKDMRKRKRRDPKWWWK